MPGRGEALTTPEKVGQGIAETRAFLEDVFRIAREGAAADQPLKQVYDRALHGAAAEIRPLGDLRPLHAVRRQPRL